MIKRSVTGIICSLLLVAAAMTTPDQACAQPVNLTISGRSYPPQPARSSNPSVAAHIPSGNPSSVHIKNNGAISFRSGYYKMKDGGGYMWDLQYYGSVYRGTPYAYSGGMYCHVNGSNVQANNSSGWRNKAGDEIEIGPCNRSGLKVSRRIKVYKDRPLARWLDIFENPGSAPITVNVQIYTRTNYSIRQTTTDTGQTKFGSKDWAFRTATSSSNGVPTLHMVTSKGAKLRPTVRVQSNTISVQYNGLTIPAGKTIILCHFESQHRDASVHSNMMSKFPMYKVMKDLPMAVRVRILNMKVGSSFGGVDLERLETSDNVLLKNDDPIVGEIRNESFKVSTIIGPIDLKPDNLVGMAMGPTGNLRFAMIDGQVISGTSAGTKLEVALGASGLLHIPLDKISQWSYRISPSRPGEPKPLGPNLTLATGDHLAIDTSNGYPKLTFRWACGAIDLDGKHLLEIVTTSPGSGKFNVVFLNGTRISGVFAPSVPEGLGFDVKLGGAIRVKGEKIEAVRFGTDSSPDATLTNVVLSGGDKLFGELTDEMFVLTTSYGKVDVSVSQIKGVKFKAGSPDQTTVQMWNGSVIKGKLNVAEIGFAVTQGDRWALPIGKITSITCPQAIPPRAMRLKIEKLIAQLGAEGYQDRQSAATALVGMGKGIIPLIKPHLSNDDPEIRQRIEDVLEQLGYKSPSAPTVTVPHVDHLHGGRWQLGPQQGGLIINNGGVINLNNAPAAVW
ncbi:MAG: hypothetical protein QGG42_19380 [Phycisphaerae bacterium]|jgi:hypothetical protein|nr:hypothetical protein [Phycisphaerae bacterium]